MNKGKNGRPFKYPQSLILFLGIIRFVFKIPYRQLEGFARKLKILSPSHLQTTAHCYCEFKILTLTKDQRLGYVGCENEVVIAVNATGVKVTNRGEWMRKKRKGYIKIHVAVDIKTKQVLSVEVSDDRTKDREKFVSLVEKAKGKTKVKKVLR